MEKQTLTTVEDVYWYVKDSSTYHRIDSPPELVQFECSERVPSWFRVAIQNIDGVISFDHLVTFNKSYIDDEESGDVCRLCVQVLIGDDDGDGDGDGDGVSDMMLVGRSINLLRNIVEPFTIESVDVLDTGVVEIVITISHTVEQSMFEAHNSIVGVESVS